MITPKSLPAHPSLESLRKQAKQLAREIAAGKPDAIARARGQLPDSAPPISRRDAQLVLAREYGFPGWRELMAEAQQRVGLGLEWAASEAHRIIHDNDVKGLQELLAEYPALLSWQDQANSGGLLAMATNSFGDSGDPAREQQFTRAACAELLIDAGAIVAPSTCDGLIDSRARGLLQLFQRKGVLPRTLKFFAALGDLEAVRARLDAAGEDFASVHAAFWSACSR